MCGICCLAWLTSDPAGGVAVIIHHHVLREGLPLLRLSTTVSLLPVGFHYSAKVLFIRMQHRHQLRTKGKQPMDAF